MRSLAYALSVHITLLSVPALGSSVLAEIEDKSTFVQNNVRDTSSYSTHDGFVDSNTFIAAELRDLRKIPWSSRTTEQTERIRFLETQQRNILEQFLDFIGSNDVQELIQSRHTSIDFKQDILSEVRQLTHLRDNLRDIGNAVIISPLILEESLELMLVTADGPPEIYSIPIGQDEITTKISDFQQLLSNRHSNPQPLAQELYDLLFQPLENALVASETETIIYAPNGLLRYIPISALHDGSQWLVEKYKINYVNSSTLTDLNLRPRNEATVLAGAFREGIHEIFLEETGLKLNGLPYAGIEVDFIQENFPSTVFFDNDFSLAAILPLANDHSIVHLATHASVIQGTPSDSFILFGNGDILTEDELESWRGMLMNVDLVVLSACGTGNGLFAYLLHRAGARSVLASLWNISDSGTSELMKSFYKALKVNYLSEAEALRQAQIALITGNQIDTVSGERFVFIPRDVVREGGMPSSRLSHPYYWAPFVLIGNGL